MPQLRLLSQSLCNSSNRFWNNQIRPVRGLADAALFWPASRSLISIQSFSMAESKIEQRAEAHAAQQDDLLWTRKLAAGPSQALTGRLLPSLKSRVASLLDERFEKFFKTVSEEAAGRKQGSVEQRVRAERDLRQEQAAQNTDRTQNAVTQIKGAFDAAIVEAQRFSPTAAGTESRDNRERPTTPQQLSRRQEHAKELAKLVDTAQRSWVTFAAQLIGANLKRLGVEPSELDDIRLFLIREGAASYEELKRLTRLPDSLDPAAELKALEDVRTLMLAYVVQATQEQILADLESESEVEPLGFPKPLVNRFAGIPEREIDQEKLLELAQTI
mgnify:CR=1 FL=1